MGIQDGHHLENLFFASATEPKGQLTLNLVGSIEVTCRSEIAKIVLMRNLNMFCSEIQYATTVAILNICFELLLNRKAS